MYRNGRPAAIVNKFARLPIGCRACARLRLRLRCSRSRLRLRLRSSTPASLARNGAFPERENTPSAFRRDTATGTSSVLSGGSTPTRPSHSPSRAIGEPSRCAEARPAARPISGPGSPCGPPTPPARRPRRWATWGEPRIRSRTPPAEGEMMTPGTQPDSPGWQSERQEPAERPRQAPRSPRYLAMHNAPELATASRVERATQPATTGEACELEVHTRLLMPTPRPIRLRPPSARRPGTTRPPARPRTQRTASPMSEESPDARLRPGPPEARASLPRM